jgi:drug/metabolite transporter (DMT)-like permease
VPVLLGLVVALTYGTGDFFGGLSSRRSSAVAVVVRSYGWSLAAMALLLAVTRPAAPLAHDLLIGVAVGFIGPIGIVLLYKGLGSGRMSVVAPVTAVGASIVPVAWGLLTGERPSALALVGVAAALVAVVLISGAPDHPDSLGPATASTREVLPLAVGSGLAFGTVYVLLGSTSKDAGIWPLIVARPISIVLVGAGALLTGRSLQASRLDRWTIAAAGIADIVANVVFLAAAHRGLLSIVAVVSSLYPASTVVLARFVLGERLHRMQLVGLALAACGVMAMASG